MIKLPDQVELSSPSAERAVWGYNEAQLNQAIADALEEAAEVCDNPDCLQNSTFDGAAIKIRQLKERL